MQRVNIIQGLYYNVYIRYLFSLYECLICKCVCSLKVSGTKKRTLEVILVHILLYYDECVCCVYFTYKPSQRCCIICVLLNMAATPQSV